MIPRYSKKELTAIWQDENRYRIWLDIETFATEALAKLGVVPEQAALDIRNKGDFDIEKIAHIEQETKHDVIAFLTNLAEYVGDNARFVHQGMTSSDVLDTCLSVQLKQAGDIIVNDIKNVLSALENLSLKYKYAPAIGRSHGIHAEPITIGLRFTSFYAEFQRNLKRMETAIEEISVCAISGAVGTFANIDPYVEQYVAEKMGLNIEPISTQVIPRDRHASFFATLGVIASSIERLAVEVRHLQRTELLEAEEFFSKGQKGSSAMPHKRNPVLSENLTGLARLIRGYAMPAMENVALWHERDISHSSVERVIAPDATIAMDFALSRLASMLDNLVIYPENALNNLNHLNGLYNSQRILLALTQKGISREDAYLIVQRNAMKCWQERRDFKEIISEDKDVTTKINADEIDGIFDINYHLKHIDTIYNRVFQKSN